MGCSNCGQRIWETLKPKLDHANGYTFCTWWSADQFSFCGAAAEMSQFASPGVLPTFPLSEVRLHLYGMFQLSYVV